MGKIDKLLGMALSVPSSSSAASCRVILQRGGLTFPENFRRFPASRHGVVSFTFPWFYPIFSCLKWVSFTFGIWVQNCQLIEPLKLSNGAPPCIPILHDRIPSLLTPKQLHGPDVGGEKRLRIFSGTANPVLAQVILFSRREFGFLRLLSSYSIWVLIVGSICMLNFLL